MEIEFTIHAAEMQEEREISEEQILDAILHPDAVRPSRGNTTAYYRLIKVSDGPRVPAGRYLRVIVNETVKPNRVVSAYPRNKIG